jgi:hypothetical protein
MLIHHFTKSASCAMKLSRLPLRIFARKWALLFSILGAAVRQDVTGEHMGVKGRWTQSVLK